MSTLLFTVLAACVLVLLSLALLGIGWLLTGKSRIIRGACGMDPHRLRDEECGKKDIQCGLCGKTPKENDDHNS